MPTTERTLLKARGAERAGLMALLRGLAGWERHAIQHTSSRQQLEEDDAQASKKHPLGWGLHGGVGRVVGPGEEDRRLMPVARDGFKTLNLLSSDGEDFVPIRTGG